MKRNFHFINLKVLMMFGPATVLWMTAALTRIDLPGIYMDAVNPDYLIVRFLNPDAISLPAWLMPGNLLFDRFPVIIQIYHGALTYYAGLPFYAAFGTGVLGIRLANLAFGLMVLMAAGTFLRAFQVRTLIASLCLAALALDPGFLFSFRTQFYITLLPIAAILLSAALVQAKGESPTRRTALCAGLLAGVACYGYFIHAFFVPAVFILALWRWYRPPGFTRLIACWLAGFSIGVLPYAAGFLLTMVSTGGPGGLINYMSATVSSLGVQSSTLTCWARGKYFANLLTWTISDVGPQAMMLGKTVAPVFSEYKTIALLGFPALAITLGIANRKHRETGLLFLAGIISGFFILVMCFGNRLWLHHAAPLLPVLYLALALSLERFCHLFPPHAPKSAAVMAAVIAGLFLIFNIAACRAVFLELAKTGGVGLSSNAISRYAEDSLRDPSSVHRFFPDWGVFMSFVMITHGQKPFSTDFSPQSAKKFLCAGQDAEVAAVAGQSENRFADWIKSVDWGEPARKDYNQRDGKPVLQILRWRSAEKPFGACVD